MIDKWLICRLASGYKMVIVVILARNVQFIKEVEER